MLPEDISFCLPSCTCTCTLSLSEQFSYQFPKRNVFLEPTLPRVADDLNDFGERGYGEIENLLCLDIIALCDFSGW